MGYSSMPTRRRWRVRSGTCSTMTTMCGRSARRGCVSSTNDGPWALQNGASKSTWKRSRPVHNADQERWGRGIAPRRALDEGLLLVGGPTSGEVVHRTRGERAIVGHEPRDQRRHFLGPPYPSHRNLRHEEIHRALLHLLEELGADDGRGHRVDENAARARLLGERLGQADHSGLGRRVGHEGRIAFLAGDGGDVDDAPAPLLQHHADGRSAAVEDAREIHVDDPAPVLVGQLPNGKGAAGDPRVVHEDVEATEGRVHLTYRRLHLARHRHIGGEGERGGTDALGRLLRHGRVEVQHGDASAVRGQTGSDGVADAARRPRDERSLPGQRRRAHVVSSGRKDTLRAQAWVRAVTPRMASQYRLRTTRPVATMRTDMAAAWAVSPASSMRRTATAASSVPGATMKMTAERVTMAFRKKYMLMATMEGSAMGTVTLQKVR